jgi:hypothetical protein
MTHMAGLRGLHREVEFVICIAKSGLENSVIQYKYISETRS